MILTAQKPNEWARNSGYEIIQTNDEYRESIKLVYSPYPAFQTGNIEVMKTAYDNPIVIKAKNIKLVIINNDRSKIKHNYKYLLISSNNDILVDDQVNKEYWLQYLNILKKLDLGKWQFNEKNIEITQNIKNEDGLIFVGGQAHYGHWLVDHLPIILLCEKNKIRNKAGKYLTSQLNDFQIETLQSLNIDIDVMQLNVGQSYINIINIEEIKIIAQLSIYKSYQLLRNNLSLNDNFYSKERENSNKNRLYFERGMQRGLKRVANEDQVIEYLKSENFDIVKPEELSINQKKLKLYNYDLFISTPGSAFFNFSIFSNLNAKIIYCIHESALYNKEIAVYGASYYQCPDLYRTTLIPAFQPNLKNMKEPNYDESCIIDIESIKKILDKLKN